MWREFIKSISPNVTFSLPAAVDLIAKMESTLDVVISEELKGLLCETDGVLGDHDLGIIWPVRKIKEMNIVMRNLQASQRMYMLFDTLLFFAEAGNGDLFALPIINSQVGHRSVFAWNHENDSRTWVAPSIKVYLEWWLKGIITI